MKGSKGEEILEIVTQIPKTFESSVKWLINILFKPDIIKKHYEVDCRKVVGGNISLESTMEAEDDLEA